MIRSALRGRRIVIAVVGLALVLAGTGLLVGRPMWKGRCAASFGELSPQEMAKLHSVPLDQVNVDDFEQVYRPAERAFLDAARHPLAPLGAARHAVVVPPDDYADANARLANSDDGDVRFEVGGGGLIGTESLGGIVQVDDETGQAAWGRRQAGYGVGGGDLSDRFVMAMIPRNKAPRVAAVDTANGDLAWCTELGDDTETGWRPTFDSTGAGDEMFTVRDSDSESDSDRDVRLSRLDAHSGKVAWDVPVKGVSQADSVHLLRDQVLLSQLHTDISTNGLWSVLHPDDSSQPVDEPGAVVARSAADGAASWTYRGPDDTGWVSNVVGSGKDVAVVISRRVVDQGRDELGTQTWMTGIDRTGRQLWKHDFKNQYKYDITGFFLVTGDLVLSQEARDGKADVSMVVARSLATGAEVWRTPLTGTSSAFRSSESEVVGDRLLVAAHNGGLLAVDLRTGDVSNPLPGKTFGRVDGIVSDGRTVTIDVNGLFITFDRTF